MTIGQPLPRPDGRAKVTGAARYAADHNLPNQLHAALVTAPIPAGRVVAIDAAAALAARGVVGCLRRADLPRFGEAPSPPLASVFMPMQGDDVRYEGQPGRHRSRRDARSRGTRRTHGPGPI
jgi:xanthine dehydrogenase YagR molybdenum-binding subunit